MSFGLGHLRDKRPGQKAEFSSHEQLGYETKVYVFKGRRRLGKKEEATVGRGVHKAGGTLPRALWAILCPEDVTDVFSHVPPRQSFEVGFITFIL